MPNKNKRDLLIHFDESREEIILYTVASIEVADIRAREFDGTRTNIEWFQGKSPDEAERDIGGMVFSLIDTFSKKKINIRDYKSLNDTAHKKYVAELELESNQGSADAKYHLFIEYHSRAVKELDTVLLYKAESLLKESSALGHKESSTWLNNDWSLMKSAALKRIERAKKS